MYECMKVCDFCGKEYMAHTPRTKYCCEKCAKKAKVQQQRGRMYSGTHSAWERQIQNKYEIQDERIKRRKNQQELVNIAVEAKALGMSYGKYVAMLEMGVKF